MAQKKLEKAILICGNSQESIDTKKKLEDKKVPYKEIISQNKDILSLITIPNYKVVRGYKNIINYVDSLNFKI